jgi:hypothetical protein
MVDRAEQIKWWDALDAFGCACIDEQLEDARNADGARLSSSGRGVMIAKMAWEEVWLWGRK